jgi:integrase
MKTRINNLVERNGWYYFRSRIPYHNSRKEIRLSLKTQDLQKAVMRCKFISTRLKEFSTYRNDAMIDREVMEQRIRKFIQDSLRENEEHLATYGKICQGTINETIQSIDKFIEACKEAIKTNDHDSPLCVGKDILSGLDYDQRDLMIANRESLKAQMLMGIIRQKRLNGNFDEEFDLNMLTKLYSSISASNPPSGVISVAPIAKPAPKPVYNIKEFMDRFITDKVKGQEWGQSTEEVARNIMDIFIEICGDGDIKSVNHMDLLNFRDNYVRKMPKNLNKRPEFQKMTISQAIKANDGPVVSIKTVNNKMSYLCSFFKWCFIHGLIPHNPATNLLLKTNRKAFMERQEYGKSELEQIFTLLNSPDKIRQWRSFKLFIPLIALYSGARQGEICQLLIKDIINVNGIPCFNIDTEPDDDKSIKTVAGYRKVPIHPILLQLNLLGYILAEKEQGNGQVWSMFTRDAKNGYSHKFQRFYGNFNRKYITQNPKKVFHSFRHNFTNNLKQAGVEESKIAEIVGHKISSMTFGRYGKPFEPKVLLEAMLKLDYGIDIFKILEVKPLSDETIAEQIKELPVKE